MLVSATLLFSSTHMMTAGEQNTAVLLYHIDYVYMMRSDHKIHTGTAVTYPLGSCFVLVSAMLLFSSTHMMMTCVLSAHSCTT